MKGLFGKKDSGIESIDVEQKHLKLRIVLFAVFLVLGAAALIYGLSGFFSQQTGWQPIEREQSSQADCSDEFLLQYDIGHGDIMAKEEYNQIARLYGEVSAKAYQLFNENQLFEGVNNVAYLNAHPNEDVTVDEALYKALEKLDNAKSRQGFLAPMWEYYSLLFSCSEDWETESYDPAQNKELAELFKKIAVFAANDKDISIQLLGENKVRLNISEEYLAFGKENDIYVFFGFHYMKNAFITDYMAEALISGGFTHGVLSSFDGFTRNLDDRGTEFSLNLFDKTEKGVLCTGTLDYSKPVSIISLRSFPVNSADDARYYVMQNGEIKFPYMSIKDGSCLAAVSNLVCLSEEESCSEVLLKALDVYIGDEFRPSALIADGKISIVYSVDKTIWTSYDGEITDVTEGYEVKQAKVF